MFANTQMMGMDLGFPDVCLTPAGPAVVPIPYPNIAMGPTAIPDQFTMFIMAMPVHNLGTEVPLTNGDNVLNVTGVDHQARRGNNGIRLQSDRSYRCGCWEPPIVDSPGQLGRTSGPNIDMQRHWKVRDWRRIPGRAFMDQVIVN